MFFPLGSYCYVENKDLQPSYVAGRYIVTTLQNPTPFNGVYRYNLRLDRYYKEWQSKIFKYAPDYGSREASWSLTSTIDKFLTILLRNLNAYGYKFQTPEGEETEYSFKLTEFAQQTIQFSESKAITFNNTNLINALNTIAKTWDCEWWIEDSVINFGRCEIVTASDSDLPDLELGVNVQNMSASATRSAYATRIYCFGSTKNIPSYYRKHLVFQSNGSGKAQDSSRPLRVSNFRSSALTFDPLGSLNLSIYDNATKSVIDNLVDENILTIALNSFHRNDISREYNVQTTTRHEVKVVDVIDHYIGSGDFKYPVYRKEVQEEDIVTNTEPKDGYVKDGVLTIDKKTFGHACSPVYPVILSDGTMAERGIYKLSVKDAKVDIEGVAAIDTHSSFDAVVSVYLYATTYDEPETVLFQETLSVTNTTKLSIPIECERQFEFDGSNGVYLLVSISIGEDEKKIFKITPDIKIEFSEITINTKINVVSGDYSGQSFNVSAKPVGDKYESVYFDIPELSNGDKYEIEKIHKGTIPGGYYTEVYGSDVVKNGVIATRLMLPDTEEYPFNNIDAREDLTDAEIIESVVTNDDIFPRQKCKTTNITTKEYTDTEELSTGEKVKTKWNAYRFALTNNDLPFNFSRDYILERKTLSCTFGSGRLNGMTFELIFNPSGFSDESREDAQIYEIVRNEDYGRPLPDDTIFPEEGDEVVLFNFDPELVGEELIPVAEAELAEEMKKYMSLSKIDNRSFEVTLMYDTQVSEDPIYLFQWGHRVNLINDAYFKEGNRISRVIGIECKLDYPFDKPKYIIGESASSSKLQELSKSIESLQMSGGIGALTGVSGSGVYLIKENDSTAESDSNVYSAKRSQKEFLSKTKNDSTPFDLASRNFKTEKDLEVGGKLDVKGLATVFNMLQSDGFRKSMSNGKGWGVDQNGNAQFESVEVRSALRVLELVYNRLSAEESEFVFTESGTIEKITPDYENGTFICTLKKRGETDFHAFKKRDIVRGMVNNLENLGGGEIFTVWMLIVDVDLAANTITTILYADDCVPSGENYIPTDLMVIHRWGNDVEPTEEAHKNEDYASFIEQKSNGTWVNKRQSCWYISSLEKRLVMLDGVNAPILKDRNYSAFFGLPGGFENSDSFKGHTIDPSQPYVYARGAFFQDVHYIDYQGNVIRQERHRGVWVADPSEPYTITDTTFDTVYHNNSKWQCAVENATEEPSSHSSQWVFLYTGIIPIYRIIPSVNQVLRVGSGTNLVDDVITCDVVKDSGIGEPTYAYEDEINVYIGRNQEMPEATPSRRFVILPDDKSIEFYLFNKDSKLGEITFGSSIFSYLTGKVSVSIISKGENGITPIIGSNGNWWINGVDTGLSSKGDEGHSPYIGNDGYWYEWDAELGKYVKTETYAKGNSVIAQYSPDNSNWHFGFQIGDLYMRTSDDSGVTWGTPMRIVGEEGAQGNGGDYIDTSFGISASLTNPSDVDSWHDAPIAVTDAKPYLWMRQMKKVWDSANKTYKDSTDPDWRDFKYIRVTGEKGATGNGISNVTEEYGVSKDVNTLPLVWKTREEAQNDWNESLPALWNRETTTYTNNGASDVRSHVVAIWSNDGRSITDIIDWYKTSNNISEEIGKEEAGWSTNAASLPFDADHKYLWNFEEIIFNIGNSIYTTPSIKGIFAEGARGKKGAVLRGASLWNATTRYQSGQDDEEYIDIVLHPDYPNELFLCKVSHSGVAPSASTIKNSDWDEQHPWTQSDVKEFIATKFFLSEQIRTDIISVAKEMIIEGNTYKCHFGLVDGEPNLIFEDKNGNIVCRVYQNGLFFPVSAEGYLDKATSSTITTCRVTNSGSGLLAEATYEISYKVVVSIINTGYNQGTFNEDNVSVMVRLNGATTWTPLATDSENPSRYGSHEIVLNPDADGNLLFVGSQTKTQAQYLEEMVTIDYKLSINGSIKDIGQFSIKPTYS